MAIKESHVFTCALAVRQVEPEDVDVLNATYNPRSAAHHQRRIAAEEREQTLRAVIGQSVYTAADDLRRTASVAESREKVEFHIIESCALQIARIKRSLVASPMTPAERRMAYIRLDHLRSIVDRSTTRLAN